MSEWKEEISERDIKRQEDRDEGVRKFLGLHCRRSLSSIIRLDRLGIRHACTVPGTESDWEYAHLFVPDVWSIACLFDRKYLPYVCVVWRLVVVHAKQCLFVLV